MKVLLLPQICHCNIFAGRRRYEPIAASYKFLSKLEPEQFRQWKASREKELLQLREEGRKNEFERHKLQALNQRQKLVCLKCEFNWLVS
ncbi:hypothetical protein HN51_044573 [Arachis hypogaea]